MIIDFNRYNGGGSGSGSTDLRNYWNSAVTEQHIESAATEVYSSAVSYTDAALADISLDGYYTSAQTDSAISQAVAPFYTSAQTDEVIAQAVSGLATEQYVQDALSGVNLENYWTSAETKDYVDGAVSGISLDGYYTSAQTDSAITAAVAGKADAKILVDFDHTTQAERASIYAELKALYDGGSGATINKNYDFYKTVNTWQGQKIDYYTFSGGSLVFGLVVSPENITDQVVYAQVMTIDAAGNVNVVTNTVGGGGGGDMSNYWNSAETKTYVDSAATNLQDQLDTMDEVIADALNDLNGQLVTKVSSSSVSTIWKGTQAEYDLIVTKDPYTFYIIVSSN